MIRITSKLYIHFLTIIMLIVCYFNKHMGIFLCSYAVMALHELSHLISAVAIGLKIDKIVFYPYGVNLKLRNRIVNSIADEIILYLAGPLLNCLFALGAIVLYKIYRQPWMQYLYIANIMFFIVNMLPIYPLDGGIILKKILSYFWGSKAANKIMLIISSVLICGFVGLSIYAICVTGFNFSLIFLTVFLLCSMLTQSEKYDVDFVKELMFYNSKSKNKLKHILVNENEDYKKIVERFCNNRYGIVYVENDKGEITKIMGEREVVDALVKCTPKGGVAAGS